MNVMLLLSSRETRIETTVRIYTTMDYWPPPARVLGREFHRSLAGTYELSDATDGSSVRIARYYLRLDDDYQRIKGNMARLRE